MTPFPTNSDTIMAIDAPFPPIGGNSASIMDITPAHLPSRTRKRFRGGRPSDEIVHRHTLQLLFTAQSNHHQPHHTLTPSSSSSPGFAPEDDCDDQDMLYDDVDSTLASGAVQKTSLHAFWSLPASTIPRQTALPGGYGGGGGGNALPTLDDSSASRCEDCNVALEAPSAPSRPPDACEPQMQMQMHLDRLDGMDAFGCLRCERSICDACAAVFGSADRLCYGCVRRSERTREWVGGLGWM
ncbi:MAG: hypothetical protein M1825_005146 [Sarcosagium campestre]|nr:MAG: hypothetical protein M1825_005146 [Sarcosagium campestre]